ncbi:MAG: polysaccharide deacetylase family protein [Porcipelethomonas sp.]
MMNWKNKYKKAFTLSYDDGNEQDLHLLEIINRYGIKCTFNLNTSADCTGSTWKYMDKWVRRLDPENFSEIYKGHETAVHGRRHLNLTECSDHELREEINGNIEDLKKIIGKRPCGMAYAYGAYNEEIISKISAMGIKYSRGTDSSRSFCMPENLMCLRPTCHHDDEQLFELAEKFLKLRPDTPKIFYVWGHSYEFDGKRNWDKFERFCDLIAGKDDIFYGTNEEVLL